VRESTIEKAVCKYAKAKNWLVYKFSSGVRSVPDRLMFKNKKILLIEFKAPGKLPTLQQLHNHKKFEKAGFKVHVIDNVEEGKRLIDEQE
jgi:hypothetical protein